MLSGKDDHKSIFLDEDIMSEPIPFVYGLVWMAMSTLAFNILSRILIAWGPPKVLLSADEVEKWKWRNLMISWIHALLISVWDISCFYYYPDLTSDLVGYYNVYIYTMVAVSAGYFLHDSIDVISSRMAKANWEVILHHIALVSMLIYNLALCQCIAYSTIALMAEVNTSFLHARKLLQMHKTPFSNPLYRLVCILNLLTFVSCRFLCFVWIGYGIMHWYERVPLMYLIGISVSLFIMVIINLILFSRLLSNDVLRQMRPRGEKNKRSGENGIKNGKQKEEKPQNGISSGLDAGDFLTGGSKGLVNNINIKGELIDGGYKTNVNGTGMVRKRGHGSALEFDASNVENVSQNGHQVLVNGK